MIKPVMGTAHVKKVLEHVFLSMLILLFPLSAEAEEMPIPVEIQIPLIMKILTFDRNFSSKVGSELEIGIIYNPEDPASLKAKNEISDILSKSAEKTIKNLPIQFTCLEYTTAEEVGKAARSNGIDVFYIAPGNSESLQELLRISQANGITTVTGVPDYVAEGVSIGIGLKQNKPQILINLPSSKSEGSALDANLLRLATVVK